MNHPAPHADALLGELRELIEDARRQVARTANAALTMTYWRIGKRLLAENLSEGRAAYGQQILASLAQSLEREFGKGFSYSALTRMVRFAELFPDGQILVSLIQELTWTHFLAILPLKDPLAREFYAEMCRVERWSVRTLRQKIGGMLFERTALSKHSEDVVRQELASLRGGQLSPELVFRDPYLLDFLGLSGTWSEKDLEVAILREMEANGQWLLLRRPPEAYDGGQGRFLPGLAVLPSPPSAPRGRRTQTGILPASAYRPNGTVFALAGQARACTG
ncbi:putative ribosome biogenesis protein NEP1-like [Ralstonia solanacearum CMR15]|nr:putative ribosome biogenesis protein NEP1-like [Ralstonia solanacearum CMR15]